MEIFTTQVILGKGCGFRVNSKVLVLKIPNYSPFLSFPFKAAIVAVHLGHFLLNSYVFTGGRQIRCQREMFYSYIAGLTLSFICPWPLLGPRYSCCPHSLPPGHHPWYNRVLGYAYSCQRAVLEAWATRRAKPLLIPVQHIPEDRTIANHLNNTWVFGLGIAFEVFIYILFNTLSPTPTHAVSQKMRPQQG